MTPDDECERQLAATPLFAGVPPAALAALAARAVDVTFSAGHVIARQGEVGTGLFVIVSGAVDIVRDGTRLDRLGAGAFFGELSVIDGAPRNAQAIAVEPTRCFALASWDLEAAIREAPDVALALLRGLAARVRELSDSLHA